MIDKRDQVPYTPGQILLQASEILNPQIWGPLRNMLILTALTAPVDQLEISPLPLCLRWDSALIYIVSLCV